MADDGRPRILITRLSHIGDCILAIPMLNALRAWRPDGFIAWVVERAAAPLLERHAALDQLIVLRPGWLKSPGTVRRLRQRLRGLEADISIDPQGLTKSALCGWLSGAKMRIGFAGRDGRELSRWLNNCLVPRTAAHMVDRGLQLLQALGIESPPVAYRLPIQQDDRRMVAAYLQQQRLSEGLAVINPGAGWDSRLWPTERYAEVARRLGEDRRLPSVVAWAGERERRWAEQIVAGSAGHARLAPATSLLQLAALLEGARFYLGSDTGPLHLAAAVGTPCISLHGPTPAWQSGPYGAGHLPIQEVYLEAGRRRRRKASNDSMKAISVDRVCQACDQLLAGRICSPEREAA